MIKKKKRSAGAERVGRGWCLNAQGFRDGPHHGRHRHAGHREPGPLSLRTTPSAVPSSWSALFFFKQKTAYEIGLGIPAEPLFRSLGSTLPVGSVRIKCTAWK